MPTWPLLGLLLACACTAPEPPATEGVQAQALHAQLESYLVAWTPRAGAVELTFLRSARTPRYRVGQVEPDAEGRLVLGIGETLALVDRHFLHEYTLRDVGEATLAFDYRYRHRPPNGPVERDQGRLALRRVLTETGFKDSWRSCSTDAQCTVLPVYCNGHVGVARTEVDRASLFFGKVGRAKSCRVRPEQPLPEPRCVGGLCQPGPRFPK